MCVSNFMSFYPWDPPLKCLEEKTNASSLQCWLIYIFIGIVMSHNIFHFCFYHDLSLLLLQSLHLSFIPCSHPSLHLNFLYSFVGVTVCEFAVLGIGFACYGWLSYANECEEKQHFWNVCKSSWKLANFFYIFLCNLQSKPFEDWLMACRVLAVNGAVDSRQVIISNEDRGKN